MDMNTRQCRLPLDTTYFELHFASIHKERRKQQTLNVVTMKHYGLRFTVEKTQLVSYQ